ncbi:unnamed protein product [Fusarium venenatum]|uniref:Zn(2)-C6 fungal-type domain-containing protein n=1 Tax=Fusarium venenatum TaxID=56646 RepID=A0A2L2TT26_9HYPO|nr:uncharacterized protein FVRRES_07591 [Fusarium venenatum]CEI63155.1 unnamed protein product [Fusarium venenatum]
MSDRDDDVTPQRKRIAVACGRCRKRKIRCSGDTGNGGPCTNCKNAGYEPCQFLRLWLTLSIKVASQETTLKGESFTYSLEASRQYQARGSSAISSLPSSTPSYTDGLPAYTTEAFVYRNPANFTYGTKSYCPLAWGHGYTDDQSYSYALYQPAYSPVHDPDYGMSYRIASGTPEKSALCVDTEPSYAYSSGNTMMNLVHRPAQVTADSTAYQNLVPDSKNVAFQSMAPDPKGLALQNVAGVNTGERVLPAPVGRSSMSSSIGSSYKNDSGSSIYSSSSSKSSQDSTSETSPVSSTSETPSSYTSYESSTSSSCLPSYTPIPQYGRSSSNDLYSHTGSSDAAMFASSQGGPDMAYRYTDTTAGVTVPVGAAAGRRNLPHLNGNGLGTFSLGHAAAPYLPHQGTAYMLPAGGDIGDAAVEHIRRSTGAGAGSL